LHRWPFLGAALRQACMHAATSARESGEHCARPPPCLTPLCNLDLTSTPRGELSNVTYNPPSHTCHIAYLVTNPAMAIPPTNGAPAPAQGEQKPAPAHVYHLKEPTIQGPVNVAGNRPSSNNTAIVIDNGKEKPKRRSPFQERASAKQ